MAVKKDVAKDAAVKKDVAVKQEHDVAKDVVRVARSAPPGCSLGSPGTLSDWTQPEQRALDEALAKYAPPSLLAAPGLRMSVLFFPTSIACFIQLKTFFSLNA